jgi:hypothetical protein
MSKTGATIQLVSREASHNNSDSACFPAPPAPAPGGKDRDEVGRPRKEPTPDAARSYP